MLKAARHSACGPDGIPYAAWQSAPSQVRTALYDAYTMWLSHGQLPAYFNISFLWLLPKGDDPRDKLGPVTRDAGDTRPLSGSNSDCKLFASSFRYKADSAIKNWSVAV